MDKTLVLEPNVKKLIFHKMSLDAIPDGGGVAEGIKFLSDRTAIANSFRQSTEWVKQAITAIRNASDPNPWRNEADDVIAGELLRGLKSDKK